MVIGQTTPSHDLETEVSEAKDVTGIDAAQIIAVAQSLTGKINQLPPAHSAIKIGGKRAYKFARKGTEVALTPREVEVKEFSITAVNLPQVEFRVVCSKGTYIRSLVRDMGEHLGVGAYLSQLCRTRIGTYKLEDAMNIDEVTPSEHADLL
jgi:tRNA pseudouridine55 synthase